MAMLILLIAPLFQTSPAGAASDDAPAAHRFVEGLSAYKSGDYETAIERFQALADKGPPSGQLYYNLGNAYFKADRLGHSIWWYEKALRLTPGDPDLNFNLARARSLMTDQPESEAQPLVKVLFFWRYQLADTQVQWLALGFNLAFWSTLILRRLMGRRPFRSWLLVLALPTLVFTATAAYNSYEASYQQQAIVLPAQLSIRAGRTPGATELFLLHAGTKVKVQARQGEHLRIAFGKDKIGWVPASGLGLI
jgi:tetratricopeptide (TPR) repeat protein